MARPQSLAFPHAREPSALGARLDYLTKLKPRLLSRAGT